MENDVTLTKVTLLAHGYKEKKRSVIILFPMKDNIWEIFIRKWVKNMHGEICRPIAGEFCVNFSAGSDSTRNAILNERLSTYNFNVQLMLL